MGDLLMLSLAGLVVIVAAAIVIKMAFYVLGKLARLVCWIFKPFKWGR